MAARIGPIIATALCGVLAAAPAFAQNTGSKPAYLGKRATAEEISRSFLAPPSAPEALTPEDEEIMRSASRGVMPTTVPTNQTPVTPVNITGGTPVAPPSPPSPVEEGCPANTRDVAIPVTFKLNSARLEDEARYTLKNVAEVMRSPKFNKCRFVIEGHTDARGTEQHNQELSQQRAESVRAFLVQNTIQQQRLTTIGKASREPYNTANPMADENRRVQFRIEN